MISSPAATRALPLVAGTAVALISLLPPTASGQENPVPASASEVLRVSAFADVDSVAPGKSFHLVFRFDIRPGWHTYWKNPGDTGAPTTIRVQAPAGFEVGAPLWPCPKAFSTDGFVTYGYGSRVALFVPVTAPPEPGKGPHAFDAEVSFLVCKEVCLKGKSRHTVTLAGSSGAPAPPDGTGTDAARADALEFRKAVPSPIEAIEGASASFDGRRLTVIAPARAGETAALFPIESPGVRIGSASFRLEDGRFLLEAPVTVKPKNAQGVPLSVGGVVTLGPEPFDSCFEFSIAIPSPAK